MPFVRFIPKQLNHFSPNFVQLTSSEKPQGDITAPQISTTEVIMEDTEDRSSITDISFDLQLLQMDDNDLLDQDI